MTTLTCALPPSEQPSSHPPLAASATLYEPFPMRCPSSVAAPPPGSSHSHDIPY